MSDTSPVLSLPFIQPAQAQKHVTHNEAVNTLDALVQTSVLSASLSSPPAAVSPGDMYIVATNATGAWAGSAKRLARYGLDGWQFFVPLTGWRTWVVDVGQMQVFDRGQWREVAGSDAEMADQFGINATADTTNRLTVHAPATLLNHEGDDHRLKINKAAVADTGSLLFQTAFSGRAEMGLAGSDDWSVRVSADGSTWTTAFEVDAQTGQMTGAAVQSSPNDSAPGRLTTVGSFGAGLREGEQPVLTPDMDDFDMPSGGTLYADTGTANRPDGQSGAGIVWRGWGGQGNGKGEQHQLFGARLDGTQDPGLFYRSVRSDGTWAEFAELFHARNITGTVSETGGVPDGAIFESGSNTQSTYTRFANGLQLCSGYLNLGPVLANGSGTYAAPYYTDSISLVFPVPFVEVPILHLQQSPDGQFSPLERVMSLAPYRTTKSAISSVRAVSLTPAGSTQDVIASYIAIGRWHDN